MTLNLLDVCKMLHRPRANPFPDVIGTYMARDALSLAISMLGLNRADTVLLPAYLCREVVKPFLGRTRVVFYDVEPDLSIAPLEIEKKLNGAKLLLIINYFGFLQPHRAQIKKLCEKHGVMMLEDCAHSLLTEGSGITGDVAIFSFRKNLPLPDGGGLKFNGEGIRELPKFQLKLYSNALSIMSLLKSFSRIQSSTLSRAGLSQKFKSNPRTLPLSTFASNGLGNLSFAQIIEKQRADYQYWIEALHGSARAVPLFKELPCGVCPLGFPVEAEDRDSLAAQLQKAGAPVKIHWRLPDCVGEEFRTSHRLGKTLLTLPICPELSRKHRDTILGVLGS
jgi:dTDP-4-amino-4,6-dideoxygalactose transaminase